MPLATFPRPTFVGRALLAIATVLALAAFAHAEPAAKLDPRAAIAKRLEVGVEAVRPSALPGIFEVARGGEVLYVSSDGKYALSGELYEIGTGHNLSEKRRIEARAVALRGVSDADAIIFGPAHPRYTVTVFTDVDCPYCRKLHSEIAEYNRLGIRIKYLFFPRQGPGTEGWHKAEQVWCAADRREALTQAKLGATIVARPGCTQTPVARTYELGEELGIRGTPGIFLDNGEYLPGYQSPEKLVQRLRELDGTAVAPAS